MRGAPFVGFRSPPCRSETINISDEGLRATVGSSDGATGPVLRVFVFGGSTMLGVGAPDWGTIPSYLAKELGRAGRRIEIVNYGAGAWTSSQSVVQLAIILKKGIRPSVVVFYDGINDSHVVSCGGSVGGIARKPDSLIRGAFDQPALDARRIAGSTGLARAISILIRGREVSVWDGCVQDQKPAAWLDRAAADIVATYENNVRIVTALGKEFGFRPYFFLQPYPLIATKKTSADEDVLLRAVAKDWDGQQETALARRVYAEFHRSKELAKRPEFHDLSAVLAHDGRTLYVDGEHLLPEGNALVADAIIEAIRPAISK
jgi:lysophospholipase L1-like esterase